MIFSSLRLRLGDPHASDLKIEGQAEALAEVVASCEAILAQAKEELKEELKATTASVPNAAKEQRVIVLEAKVEAMTSIIGIKREATRVLKDQVEARKRKVRWFSGNVASREGCAKSFTITRKFLASNA